MKTAKIYIVLVNYNSASDTIECLESVLKSTYGNFQVIVVDNSDTLESQNELSSWALGNDNNVDTSFERLVYPLIEKPADSCFVSEEDFAASQFSKKIIFIRAGRNDGFAAANNIALRHIARKTDENCFAWVLNNDTVIEKNAMEMVVSKIEATGLSMRHTLFGTPLMEYSQPKNIQAIGGLYNRNTGLTVHISDNEPLTACRYDFQNPPQTDYPIGASMIVHREFLDHVGFMTEDYFLFFEELDWASRAKQQGGTLNILEVFGIYHKQGKSTKSNNRAKKSEFVDLTFLKSRILFAKRFNRKNLWRVYASILTLTLAKRMVQGNFKIIPKMVRLVLDSREAD
ncbi:MAG TPA: glycosyltransferase family 2 protein [Flavobacterium sp.]|nr:glycosyltransferase family 2 protein [Flavobacterium sp.]